MEASPSPPMSPRRGKYMAAQVHLLDDSVHIFHIPHRSTGRLLFEEVVRKLQLLEADYFDLEYRDTNGVCYWLDHEKTILKQMSVHELHFLFLVKFYTPDPGLLEEEYTRYLFALQVKRDLATGAMPCQEHTAVLLASYIVQAEIGDFLEDEYRDHSYLSQLRLLPNQSEELDIKIMEHHREHVGQTPAEADFNLLDTSRKVELYGIRMHPAKDHEGVSLHLAVAHMGVLVFQSYTKINTFSWAKVRKLSFKRKKFLIKLHPEGYGYYKDTVEFYFDSRNECKNFWKKCIEHHAFFRCHAVKKIPRNKTRVVSRGSSFRYSGRTQKQLVEFVRENFVKRPHFERATSPVRGRRSTSMRTMSTSPRSAGATPKSGTLNSRDLHNASASSGSRSLQHSKENMLDMQQQAQYEQAQVHDDHCSRSLGSPRSDPRHHAPPSYAELKQSDPVTTTAEPGATFNYHYYQLSYESAATQNMAAGSGVESSKRAASNDHLDQNANDNDDISHDSYLLTESRGSMEGGLDSTDELDEELHIDEEKLRTEAEEIHVIKVHPEAEVYDSGKQVEIQIVENVETTRIIETVERSRSQKRGSVQREASEDSLQEKEVLKMELEEEKVNGQDRQEEDDIPYILHRRMIKNKEPAESRPPRSLPGYRSPSPGRPVVHLSKDEKKAHLDKMKSSLTSPLSPKSPREKSPGRRGFDLVTVTKLPSVDSYSSKDDTVSPTQDEDVIKKIEQKEKPMDVVNTASEKVHELSADPTPPVDFSPMTESEPDTQLHQSIEEEVNRILSEAEEDIIHSAPSLSPSLEIKTPSDREGSFLDDDEEEEQLDIFEEHFPQNNMQSSWRADDCKKSSTSSDDELPPPPPLPPQLVQDLPPPPPPPPILTPPEGIPEEENSQQSSSSQSCLPIPAIVVRAASPIGFSSSDEEPLPVSFRPPPESSSSEEEVDFMEEIELRIDEERLMQDSSNRRESFDLPPPPPPPPIAFEDLLAEVPTPDKEEPVHHISSDEEVAHMDDDHLEEHQHVIEALKNEACRSPFSIPRKASEDLPAPPGHDVSSEEGDSDVLLPSTDDLEYAHDILLSQAQLNPFSVLVPPEQHFPAPPDISSEESDDEHPQLEMESHEAHAILAQQALDQPFAVPVAQDQHFPAPPEISSEESDDEHAVLEMASQEAHAILQSQAAANPFSIPYSHDAERPGPDISSEESEEDEHVALELDSFEAHAILQRQALERPFSIPYDSQQYFPAPPEISSEESDEDQPQLEIKSSEAHQILQSQADANPFSVLIPGDGEKHPNDFLESSVLSNPYSIDRQSSSSEEEVVKQDDPYDLDAMLDTGLVNMPFRGPQGIENHPFPAHPMGYAHQYSPDEESDHMAEYYRQLGLPENPREDESSDSSLDDQLQEVVGSSSGSEDMQEELASLDEASSMQQKQDNASVLSNPYAGIRPPVLPKPKLPKPAPPQ